MNAHAAPQTIDLAGNWTLTDKTGTHTASMVLPGDGITALHQAGLIPDPYWGRNEYQLRWIGQSDWTVTRTIDLEQTDYVLCLEELDTVATVVVNGKAVFEAANAFRRYRIDISDVLTIGRNEVEIQFRSAIKAAEEEQARQPFFVPYHTQNNPLANGNMLRKQQCDFGWDWNIALAPFGIYGAIRLEPKQAARIEAVQISQEHSPGVAAVSVSVALEAPAPHDMAWSITLCGQSASGVLLAGASQIKAALRIETPDLWWPAGWGDQPLHDLVITVGDQQTRRRLGLRDLKLISEPDGVGRSFKLSVNGQDVFARGANWIPADALAGRIEPNEVRDLLGSAVAANMNMIRVWGGGRYEPGWFYDMCDELGLMVWQDFMFACNLYPATEGFLAEAALEARDVVLRLHHHACLAVWCGDNEVIGALTWFEESIKDRDRYLVAYDRLNRTLETALKDVSPEANWWPSSPSPGPLSFGDAWHDDSSGDMHFWSVWHEGRDFDHYRDVAPRFCSEFGFQSYPSMPVIRRFAAEQDWNIASPVMESHQKNGGGNARIAETMFRSFRFPTDFESFVYLSQVQQGIAIKTAVTHWRTLKPHCMGMLYWQLNDSWPVCSWSSLNHGGSWKLLHHMARHFYAPVIVTVVPQENRLAVKAVNDTRSPVAVAVELLALGLDGAMRTLGAYEQDLPVDKAVLVTDLAVDGLRPDEVLLVRWRDKDGQHHQGQDLFARRPFKAYALQPARLNLSVEREAEAYRLIFASEAPAFFVGVEASAAGRFSDNAIHVIPGEPASILFMPDDPNAPIHFSWHDLHSATYAEPTPLTNEMSG